MDICGLQGLKILRLARLANDMIGIKMIKSKNYSRRMARKKLMAYLNVSEPFPKEIHIHHKDLNPLNNELKNLQIMSNSEHMTFYLNLYWSTFHGGKSKRLLRELESILICYNNFGSTL